MKVTLNLIPSPKFYFVRTFGIAILVLALLAGCAVDTGTGFSTEPEHPGQNTEETHPFQLEPLVFASEAEEAFYGFDWKDMSLAKDVYFENATYNYKVRFADLDLNGTPEILLSSKGGYPLYGGIIPTMVFTVKGNQLEPIATVKLAQNEAGYDVYGPDSWREGWKQIYRDADGKRVILEYISRQIEGHTYGYYLYEVSLDDYSVIPVMLYREPDSHYASYGAVSGWYYYDRETGPPMSDEDIREWQANRLGAALIMPAKTVKMLFAERLGVSLGALSPVYISDSFIKGIADVFQVSKSAMSKRLRDLGLLLQ